jgi:hypothetical protein
LKHADEITFGRFRCRFVVDALQQAEEAPDPVRATVVLPGTMQRSEMVPTGAPAERSRWREPRDEMASSWRSAAAPAGLSGMCDAHHDRRADAVCSRCGRLICGLEEPTPDGNGGTACGAMVENGACPHAPVVTPS